MGWVDSTTVGVVANEACIVEAGQVAVVERDGHAFGGSLVCRVCPVFAVGDVRADIDAVFSSPDQRTR